MRGPHPQSHVTHQPSGHVTNQKRLIQKFVCIAASVNPVALKLEETATGGVQ